MSQKIFLAGGTCSGKSMLAERIAKLTGYQVTSFGSIVREYASKTGQSTIIRNLQYIGQELIDKLGYDGFLQWTIRQSPNVRWDQNLILDGVRHLEIYNCLNRMFPNNILIYCACNKETQLERLMNRDGLSINEAQNILSHNLEKLISTLESKAHLVFKLGYPIEDFLSQLDCTLRDS